jgi:hypothetical protein
VNGDLVCVFLNVHEYELFEKNFNTTFIALIPKTIGHLGISAIGSEGFQTY